MPAIGNGTNYASLVPKAPGKAPQKGAQKAVAKVNLRAAPSSNALAIPTKETRTLPLPRSTPEQRLAKTLPTNAPTLKQARQSYEQQHPATKRAEEAEKQPKSSGLAAILNIPAQVEAKGYGNLAHMLGTSSIGGKVASELGSVAAEAVNIPTQVLPALYHGGKALGELQEGKPKAFGDLLKETAKQSAVAHLVKGDVAGALKQAGEHPLNTALEAGGVASAADRGLGALGRMSGVDAAKLADEGATTVSREPRRFPAQDVPPTGATVAQRPYSKGLVRPALEKKITERPIPTSRVGPQLRKSFDRFEGEHLRITRATRDSIATHRTQAVKGVPNKGAIVPFGQWLADPKALDEAGKPLAQKQLGEMAKHLEKAPAGEFKHEADIREANLKHVKALQGQAGNLSKAYEAAKQVAKDKAALEPELVKHGVYTPETIKIAKAVLAFRFHFRDQNPFVEPTVKPGESPFKLGGPEGRPISVDEVYKRLEQEHGIKPDQLSFTTTRPFENGNAAFRSGRQPGGAKVAKGHLTGHAFMRGQFDPTYDAAIRQHMTDAGIINKARGDLRFSREYVHSRAQIARLLEARKDRLPDDQRAALESYIQNDLRAGPGVHFAQKGTKSPWQQALEAQEHLKALYPDIKLEPIRVAHPFATKEYRGALGKHLDIAATHDMLDPSNLAPDQQHWQTRAPDESAAQHDVTAGPVGLVHQEIRDRVRAYEKDLGVAHLARMPASFWRKTNIALSVRHVPGIMQEIGGRMAANAIGPLSAIRGTRLHAEIMRQAAEHPDPFVKLGAQRYDAMVGGTVSAQALDQMRHTTTDQLKAGGRVEKAVGSMAEKWSKSEQQKLTGMPLKAMRGAVGSLNKTTNLILHYERKYIEHPPQMAGLGKHGNEEFKRMHGQRVKLIGAVSDAEKALARGMLDPKAIDHAASMGREYWGDWTRASPEFKKWQANIPFAQWFLNSFRFIYHTMPAHHPIKSGVLAAIEGGTRQQRLAEGQEYKGGLPFGSHLSPTDLEPSQQGSIPNFLGNPSTERIGQQYYTPQGAVSAGPLETGLGAVLPWASSIWSVAHGVNPLTNRPLEETIEGKKQPIRDANQLALQAALSAVESFVPPYRYAQSLQKKPASYVFRPFRTEKTRLETPVKTSRAKAVLGSSLGSSLKGGSIGSSLP
jgi:hypothetical protein